MKLSSKVLNDPAVISVFGDVTVSFSGIVSDSRLVGRGFVFVAKQGCGSHGSAYAGQAMVNGAVFVISDVFIEGVPLLLVSDMCAFERTLLAELYGESLSGMDIVAVTGTKGKTTAAFIMYEDSVKDGKKASYIGTIGIYGMNGFLKRNAATTPDVYSLYALLRGLADSGHTVCYMEVSSHALEQRRVNGLTFKAAGFTNLSRDHLDYHGDMDSYFHAKKKLFREYEVGGAVINCDDERGNELYKELKAGGRRVTGFGFERGDSRFTLARHVWGTVARGDGLTVTMKMPGDYNAYNAVMAALLMRESGCTKDEFVFGENGVPGRLEYIRGNGFGVYVDYAHSPDSLEKVLALVKGRSQRGLILVFGCTGDRDRGKRPLMAAVGEKYATHVIVTSDDPHGEDPESICAETASGFGPSASFEVNVDRRDAIKRSLEIAHEGDNIIIAGKGHERFQVFGDYELPFNDREVVEAFLKGGADEPD